MKVLAYLRQGYAPIEFYARLKPTYLERMERWDEMRELRIPTSNGASSSSTPQSKSASLPTSLPPMRRSENDFVTEQMHDVTAWLQVCELAPDGTYKPVPVVSSSYLDPGAFQLHQGLQRRLVLTLSSHSGRQLPWTEVTRIRLGNIRHLDAKGLLHDSPSKALTTLPLLQDQTIEYRPDGTGNITAEALWDSSVHNSILLNRVTGAGQRILVQLTWSVAIDTCAEPVQFSMDAAVTILMRDARPPSRLTSLFGSTKILPKSSTLFSVKLTPPLTRSPKDLWRLDTAEKYVRGEEALGVWRPRGVTVVEDYSKLSTMERRAADVQAIRVILAASPHGKPVQQQDADVWAKANDVRSEELLGKSLALWQKRFGPVGEVRRLFDPVSMRRCMLTLAFCPDCHKPGTRRARRAQRELWEGVNEVFDLCRFSQTEL